MTSSRRTLVGVISLLATLGVGIEPRAAAAKAAHEVHPVVIENMKFTPDRVDARVGDTIQWTNQDIVPHTATAEDKSFDSAMIEGGKSWKIVVKKKGLIPYGCSFHPTMKALIVAK